MVLSLFSELFDLICGFENVLSLFSDSFDLLSFYFLSTTNWFKIYVIPLRVLSILLEKEFKSSNFKYFSELLLPPLSLIDFCDICCSLLLIELLGQILILIVF